MMGDIDAYKRLYPGDFRELGLMDIVHVLIALLIFFVIYLYVRFAENRVTSFVNFRLIPFIRYKMRLNRAINFVDHMLKIEIFSVTKNR
jgi:hypothetical protein